MDDTKVDPLAEVPDFIRGRSMSRRNNMLYQSYIQDVQAGKEHAIDYLKEFLVEQGAYFYSIDEVLSEDHLDKLKLYDITKREDGSVQTDLADAFRRVDQVPNYNAQGQVQEFQVTRRGVLDGLQTAPSNCSSDGSNTKKTIWNVDIFGRPFEEVISSEVAHLLPDAAAESVEWYDVACWAMGYDPRVARWEDIFRLLHGTKPGQKRTFGSGICQFVANKARINQQERLIEKNDPQLLLLPIMSRQQCLDWNGDDYDVIVLVGTDEDKGGYKWVVKEVGMTHIAYSRMGDASKDEFLKAMSLLRECTIAMVQALVNFEPPPVEEYATEEQKKKMRDAVQARKDRQTDFLSLVGQSYVTVPNVENKMFSVDNNPFRGICKVSFSNDKDKNLHPAPDPLLLVSRASVVWSVRQKFRLRASTIGADDSYSEWEEDLRQMELLHQAHRDQSLRAIFSETALSVKKHDMEEDNSTNDGMSDLSTEMDSSTGAMSS